MLNNYFWTTIMSDTIKTEASLFLRVSSFRILWREWESFQYSVWASREIRSNLLTRRTYHWAFIACLLFCLTSTSVCAVQHSCCNIQRHIFLPVPFLFGKMHFPVVVYGHEDSAHLTVIHEATCGFYFRKQLGIDDQIQWMKAFATSSTPFSACLTFFTLKSQGNEKSPWEKGQHRPWMNAGCNETVTHTSN